MSAAIVALVIAAVFALMAAIEWAARKIWPDPDFTRAFDDRPVPFDLTEAGERCEVSASCTPGDHTYSWPCDYAPGTGRLTQAGER